MKYEAVGHRRAWRVAILVGALASTLMVATPGHAEVGKENCDDPEKYIPAIQDPLDWEMGHPITCP